MNKMSKVRSLAIAFELPVFDEYSIDLATLNKKIFDSYLYYIDVIKGEFTILTFDNGNKCLLFELISIYNQVIMSNKDRELEYESMKVSISNLIEEELKRSNLMYKAL